MYNAGYVNRSFRTVLNVYANTRTEILSASCGGMVCRMERTGAERKEKRKNKEIVPVRKQ